MAWYEGGPHSVAVIGTVVALAVLGIIFKGGGFPSGIGPDGGSKSRYSSGGKGQDNNKIINNTQKTTQIDYRNYLISERAIAPNKSIQGLLFFRYTPQ